MFGLVSLLNLLYHTSVSSVCKQLLILIPASFFQLLNVPPHQAYTEALF